MTENTVTKDWYKSSFCGQNNSCAEVRFHSGGEVDIRNSKDPEGPVVTFDKDEWIAFLAGVGRGDFDPA